MSTEHEAYRKIDQAVKAMPQDSHLLPDDFDGRVQRLIEIYTSIKPLLNVVAALPIIPAQWRAGLSFFSKALEAVLESPEISGDFKSGRDL